MRSGRFKTTGYAATRLKYGLTQQGLAEKLGVSKSMIAMVETGRRRLPLHALLILAKMEIKMNEELKMANSTPQPSNNLTIDLKENI